MTLEESEALLSSYLRRIEVMAEERHLLHGRTADAFWSCSRPCCQFAAKFLREQQKSFQCRARKCGTGGGNEPTECDWPFCGCDPQADRVLAAISDSGLEIVKRQ